MDTMRLGQREAAETADTLNDLTSQLVTWTKAIGIATVLALGVAIAALVFTLLRGS